MIVINVIYWDRWPSEITVTLIIECITLYGKCNLRQTGGSTKFEPLEITVSTMYVSTMYVIKFCNVIGLYAFTSQWYLEVSIYDK